MLSPCLSPSACDCLRVWLESPSNCWLPALRAPFLTSTQGFIHTFPPKFMYGPEAGAGLDLAKLHDQLHKHTFKMLSTRANKCQGGISELLSSKPKERRSRGEKMQEKLLEPDPIKFTLPSYTNGTKFLQTSDPTKIVKCYTEIPNSKKLSTRGGSFYHKSHYGVQPQPPTDYLIYLILLLHNSPLCWISLRFYVHTVGV